MAKPKKADARAMKELGSRLQQRREELELSQSDVAERAGVRQEKVSRLERGFSELGWLSLLRIMGVLGVPCEEAAGLLVGSA